MQHEACIACRGALHLQAWSRLHQHQLSRAQPQQPQQGASQEGQRGASLQAQAPPEPGPAHGDKPAAERSAPPAPPAAAAMLAAPLVAVPQVRTVRWAGGRALRLSSPSRRRSGPATAASSRP